MASRQHLFVLPLGFNYTFWKRQLVRLSEIFFRSFKTNANTHLLSSPTGPAEHWAGGSRARSLSSCNGKSKTSLVVYICYSKQTKQNQKSNMKASILRVKTTIHTLNPATLLQFDTLHQLRVMCHPITAIVNSKIRPYAYLVYYCLLFIGAQLFLSKVETLLHPGLPSYTISQTSSDISLKEDSKWRNIETVTNTECLPVDNIPLINYHRRHDTKCEFTL